jgi:hypothetical protein
MEMLRAIVPVFSEKTCERVSVTVRMTADAMRFSEWDDKHTACRCEQPDR